MLPFYIAATPGLNGAIKGGINYTHVKMAAGEKKDPIG